MSDILLKDGVRAEKTRRLITSASQMNKCNTRRKEEDGAEGDERRFDLMMELSSLVARCPGIFTHLGF